MRDALLLHPGEPDDPDEPQRGASDPAASVWVAASAGTGKTKVLSDRVLRLMLSGTEPRRILCLTYTRAAAAEMANRLAQRLGEWASLDDARLVVELRRLLGRKAHDAERHRARTLFARVLDSPGGLNIQTIHAFCQSLLGRFPLEADIAPHAQPMEEREATDLRQRALQEVLADADRGGGPLADALATVVRHLRESRFGDLMAEIAGKPGRFEAMIAAHGSVAAATEAVRELLALAPDETPASVLAAGCDDDACDVAGLWRAAEALATGSDADCARSQRMRTWLAADTPTRALTFATWAGNFLAGLDKQPHVKADKYLATKRIEAEAPGTLAVLREEGERLLQLLPRRCAAITAEATAGLLVVAAALLHRYRTLKHNLALLDYEDLIEGARRLLHSTDGDWVLYKLDGGLDHLLVDEAQDTAPRQWHILHALTAEFFAGKGARGSRRTIFAVGDVKQSIFSFQGADPGAFLASRERYSEGVRAAGGDWRPIAMKTSFRSTRAVLAAVDATFASTEMTQAIALEADRIVHQAWRKLDGGSVEIWPPLRQRERERPPAWEPPVQRSAEDAPQSRLARLIAQRIATMLEQREPLVAKGRPIRPGDVMVLVRRRTQLVPALIRALKERRVPVAGIDRMLLTEQLAVMDLLALVNFVLLPEDDLTLATVLKGPLVGFDEDALFALAQPRPGRLWRALREAAGEGMPAAATAYGFLQTMRQAAGRLPPYEFLMKALGPLPAAAAGDVSDLADSGRRRLLSRLGRDADDAIAELLEAALVFERNHPPSLQGFVAWLERADVEIARDPETGAADAVRVMTVHGAKGLQAPIVFLPDSCQTPDEKFTLFWPEDQQGREVLLWPPFARFREEVANAARRRACERQHEEHMRLLYVAMTRAADRLIVCGWLTKNQTKKAEPKEKSWHALIARGLRENIPAGQLIEEKDPFLAAAALADGDDVLRLTCPQQTAAPCRTEDPPLAAPELPAWARRKAAVEAVTAHPLRPSHPPDGAEPAVVSPLLAEQRFRRGRLIHRLLQELPELPVPARDAAARRWLARPTHRLEAAEQAEIAAEVAAVLADPLLAPLFGADGRAEVPLSGEIGGRLIAGQIDRLVLSADAVTILDFKSDRPPPRSAATVHPAYLQQMAAYRALLRAMYPDRRVRCLLLWTQTPAAMALDDAMLDRWAP